MLSSQNFSGARNGNRLVNQVVEPWTCACLMNNRGSAVYKGENSTSKIKRCLKQDESCRFQEIFRSMNELYVNTSASAVMVGKIRHYQKKSGQQIKCNEAKSMCEIHGPKRHRDIDVARLQEIYRNFEGLRKLTGQLALYIQMIGDGCTRWMTRRTA